PRRTSTCNDSVVSRQWSVAVGRTCGGLRTTDNGQLTKGEDMSKKVKNLITNEFKKKLGDVDGVAVISPQGIDGQKNDGIRSKLHAKGLRMTVVKNTLARRATEGT